MNFWQWDQFYSGIVIGTVGTVIGYVALLLLNRLDS
jgi:hypothetical protein